MTLDTRNILLRRKIKNSLELKDLYSSWEKFAYLSWVLLLHLLAFLLSCQPSEALRKVVLKIFNLAFYLFHLGRVGQVYGRR